MSGKNESKSDGPDMDAEIKRAMEEAEAAVEAVHASGSQTDGKVDAVTDAPLDESIEIDTDGLGAEPEPEPKAKPEKKAKAAAEPTLEERVETLRSETKTLRDKWLRAVADLENYKKRVKRDIDDAVGRATQDLLAGFLPTVDNLERALEVAGDDAPDQLVKGIEMVRDEFIVALGRRGIEPVPSVGHPFDPALHDALQQVDSEDHAPGIVIREFEKGYRSGDRLLRPARVVVAGAGSTGGEAEDE